MLAYFNQMNWVVEDHYDNDGAYQYSTLRKGELMTRDDLWVTRTGEIIAIKDMDDQHLGNAMRLIFSRNFKWRADYFEALAKEAQRRKNLLQNVEQSDT